MINMVFKRCLRGVSQGCLKGVRKVFHKSVSQGFYNVFIRCLQEGFLQCVHKRLAQEAGTGRFDNASTTLPLVFLCNAPTRRLYTFARLCTQCAQVFFDSQGACLTCTSVSEKVATTPAHVCLKRCPQQLYMCF